MKRTPKRILTLAILVLAGLALQAGAAQACTDACVRVSTFCRQCEDTGTYTGATCQNIGTCGCAYTQNTCGLSASGIKADVQQADLAFRQPAGAGVHCPGCGHGARGRPRVYLRRTLCRAPFAWLSRDRT